MTTSRLRLRHLCFTGPDKPATKLEFGDGLNVIFGASDTGKSFVVEAIDFMLGAKPPLADIPERVGYDRIFLGIETSEESAFTLVRSTSGGKFQMYEGLHDSPPPNVKPTELVGVHNAKKKNNISRFLLEKIGLDGRKVRVNAENATRSMSFRDLSHLCVVTEANIQKKGSPFETGQYTKRTVEYSVFKLLLTGVDDSALVSTSRATAASQSRAGKLEIIDELIVAYQEKLAENGDDPQELTSQLERLEKTLASEREALRASEEQYEALVAHRSQLRLKVEKGTERRSEIHELIARFELLNQHYESDLGRLESISEAGSLLVALAPQVCPLCGASPQDQHRENDCDGNIDTVVAAAEAESAKITHLRRELGDTVQQLRQEAASFDRLLPSLTKQREKVEREIQMLRPELAERRATYSELIEKNASVRMKIDVIAQIADLEVRRATLERISDGAARATRAAIDLPSSTLDLFAQQVQGLLKAWNFPEADRVHFDEVTRDFIIQGKRRSSQGKGKRAITHASVTIGLIDFCLGQGRPHPGFVVLDSPLLAYRAPEGPEDDLQGTDVQDRFYEFLSAPCERQVIIVENTTPPDPIVERQTSTFFSGNPHRGRYGLFPVPSEAVAEKSEALPPPPEMSEERGKQEREASDE